MDFLAIESKKTVSFFSNNYIVKESFLENVTFILNSGAISNLYERDELNQRREAIHLIDEERGIIEIPQNLHDMFIQVSRENFHAIISIPSAVIIFEIVFASFQLLSIIRPLIDVTNGLKKHCLL
jgi:hypothetical protein